MVRDYDPDRPVPPAVRERLLEHALRAPSAGFTQGWAFLVLEDAADRELFWSVTSGSAPGGPPTQDAWLTRMRRAPPLVVPLSRSGEHTAELQSRQYLVCRLLLEKKKKTT